MHAMKEKAPRLIINNLPLLCSLRKNKPTQDSIALTFFLQLTKLTKSRIMHVLCIHQRQREKEEEELLLLQL